MLHIGLWMVWGVLKGFKDLVEMWVGDGVAGRAREVRKWKGLVG